MAFEVPTLPYAFNALEPHIDAKTMEIHHGKHHAAYVSKLNGVVLVVDFANGEIYTFNDASGLNAAETPDFTLTVDGAAGLTAIAVDSSGTGYIVDNANDAVFSYDDVATLNGAFTPDRTIQGANTLLDGPIRVFLTE